MLNFQDTFETRKRLFISPFSICMTVPLILFLANFSGESFRAPKSGNGSQKQPV